MLDAGVAEADGLALRVGDDRDVGLGGKAHAEAVAADFGAQFGACLDVDEDALVLEADLRVLRVSITTAVTFAAKIVASVSRGEELFVEGALERLGGDFDLNGAGGEGRRERHKGKDAEEEPGGLHASSILWALRSGRSGLSDGGVAGWNCLTKRQTRRSQRC